MTKENLLIINGNQFGYSAGHYYYCKYLSEHYQIDYICYDRLNKKINLEGVKVHYLPFKNNKFERFLNFIIYSIKISRKLKPEILFVVYFDFASIFGVFGFAKKKKILDIRSGSLKKNKILRNIFNLNILLQTFFFDKRIILSDNLRTKLRIKKTNTLILPLGSDTFYSGVHDYKKLNLLYIGTLDERRIFETIEGISIFLSKNRHTKLKYTIIGFGTEVETNKIIDTIHKFNLFDFVKYEGRKNHTEISKYFSEANIGIVYIPIEERYEYQPATKLFEYGLSGLFCIATSTTENKCFINKKNGILCQDSPESFSQALSEYVNISKDICTSEIRESYTQFNWEFLCNYKLLPFLKI